MTSQPIDTRNLLYHFLQHDLASDDVWLFQALVARLVVRLGIWLPVEVYARMPLLVPYARRDPTCRGDTRRGIPDAWGAPDESGYFRDDNSLVKGVPRSMAITSTLRRYMGRSLGAGFVACHVWRIAPDEQLASRNPLTYSFVPNLVWLPAQVAGLTDREGSFAQQYLQAVSRHIYSQAPVNRAHAELVATAWSLLPGSVGIPDAALPAVDDLNYFVTDEPFFRRRSRMISLVAEALRSGTPTAKVVSRRYTAGIPHVSPRARANLATTLDRYAAGIASLEERI
jgi:hypothetical protein